MTCFVRELDAKLTRCGRPVGNLTVTTELDEDKIDCVSCRSMLWPSKVMAAHKTVVRRGKVETKVPVVKKDPLEVINEGLKTPLRFVVLPEKHPTPLNTELSVKLGTMQNMMQAYIRNGQQNPRIGLVTLMHMVWFIIEMLISWRVEDKREKINGSSTASTV